MRYEAIKSFVLTLLVIISIFLTWGLWTFYPQYDTIENSNSIVKDIAISNPKEIPQIIKPTKIIFHHSNQQHFGTGNESEIEEMMKKIRKWEINDLTNISSTLDRYDYLPFLQKSGHVEILYPDEIPINMFKSILKIVDQELPSLTIDRMIVNLNLDENKGGVVYFISSDKQLVYEAKVDYGNISSFAEEFAEQALNYQEYFPYSLNEQKSIFLPRTTTLMKSIQYYTDYLDPEDFKEALFIDPNVVKMHILTYGEEYTDGSRLLRVFSGGKYIQYVNPVSNTEASTDRNSELIQSSIDFMNDHGGWTDEYRFFSWDNFEQQTLFRLYIKNKPVFNKSGLTEVHQFWGKNEIIRYQRPLLVLEIPIPSGEIVLPDGDLAIKEIKTMPDFQSNLLEDVLIGYELVENAEKINVATLVPIWSFKYDGIWRKLEFKEEVGGNEDGLE